jgi:PleD family two-component response regulator
MTFSTLADWARTRTAPPLPIAPQLAQAYPRRILAADHKPINLIVALHLLNRLGYHPDVAANGLEVLQALRRQPYDPHGFTNA